jgi:cell division protein FtsW
MLFGQNLNQANRTISLGFISFQPSELAKIILITYLARQLYLMGDRLNSFREVFVWLGIPMFLTAGLIAPENLSTAALLTMVCLVLLFIGRIKFLHILSLLGIGIALLGVYVGIVTIHTNKQKKQAQELIAEGKTAEYEEKLPRVATWINRLKALGEPKGEDYDPFDQQHYQQTYAKIDVATSSGFGKGPGKSEQRNFLPQPYSDFIYAIIVEEYGIFGAVFVLMLYIILFTRVLRIMLRHPLTFGAYLAFGLGFLVIVQAMINMGVSIGLLPVTGQPLPLVSKGGSSMMSTGIILGMILSVTRNIEEEVPEAATIKDESQQLNSNTEGEHHEE